VGVKTLSVRRRSFLTGTIALVCSQLAIGCQTSESLALSVKFLEDAVPAAMLGEFRRTIERAVRLDFSSEPQLSDLFDLLRQWKPVVREESSGDNVLNFPFFKSQKSKIPNLALIGDYWLSKAISAELIQGFDPQPWTQWKDLPQQPIEWHHFVTQNDLVWGVPYRWGSTVIAYRIDKFRSLGWTPTDWADLWSPELRQRIALPDSPRQTIGLTLKKLGNSYNCPDLNAVPGLDRELSSLHQQAKFYSSTAYQQPLQRGDVWAVVGSSRDILAMPQYGKQIAAVVPESGTALWADLWVRPANAETSELVDRWLDFCWTPQIARQLSLLTFALSPAISIEHRSDLPESLQNNSILLPDATIVKRSEFIKPFTDETTIEQYRSLWLKIRSSGSNPKSTSQISE